MAESLLSARVLISGYQGRAVLGPLDVDLKSGQFVCLLGANGTGKSTLLRTLTGLQKPVGGDVKLLDQSMATLSSPARAKLLALVLTDRIAAQSMTGYDLVALGRQPHTGWSGRLSTSDHAEIDRALRDANAQALADRLVLELSDGERQRILVARALAQQPRVIVLDEPTAFLDLPRRVELLDMLRRLAHDRGIGVLLSVHDLELALRYADEIWLLGPDGHFFRGAPEDLVLSGEMEKAFAREGFAFDLEHGALRLREEQVGAVAIEAQSPYDIWLARAAARAGYRTEPSAAIRIVQDGRHFRVTSNPAAPVLADNMAGVVQALHALRSS